MSSVRSPFQRAIPVKKPWSLSRAGTAGSATSGESVAIAASTMRSTTASRSAAFESK